MQILELYIKGYNRLNGTVSTLATNKLNDTNSTFLTSVNVGDIATNLRTAKVATIVSIDNNTTLTLSDTIFTQIGEEYRIESEYLRADLFKDESITVTDSLLNIKDLNKKERTFVFFKYSIANNGILRTQILSDSFDLLKGRKFDSSEEFAAFIKKNINNKDLFGSELEFIALETFEFGIN